MYPVTVVLQYNTQKHTKYHIYTQNNTQYNNYKHNNTKLRAILNHPNDCVIFIANTQLTNVVADRKTTCRATCGPWVEYPMLYVQKMKHVTSPKILR
jgi:hypothetical protein